MSLGASVCQVLKGSVKRSPAGGLGIEPTGIAGGIPLLLHRGSDTLIFRRLLLISINNQSEGMEKYLGK